MHTLYLHTEREEDFNKSHYHLVCLLESENFWLHIVKSLLPTSHQLISPRAHPCITDSSKLP